MRADGRHRMDVDQYCDAEAGACRGQRGGERRVIGAVILRNAARDVGAGEPPAPQVARTARTTRHQAQAAADLHRLAGLRLRADAVVDARVALIFAAVEIDPGAGAALHQHRLVRLRGAGDGIDVAILQHHQRRFGEAQRGAQGGGIVAARMRDREDHGTGRHGRSVEAGGALRRGEGCAGGHIVRLCAVDPVERSVHLWHALAHPRVRRSGNLHICRSIQDRPQR